MTKYCKMVTDPSQIRIHLEKALFQQLMAVLDLVGSIYLWMYRMRASIQVPLLLLILIAAQIKFHRQFILRP